MVLPTGHHAARLGDRAHAQLFHLRFVESAQQRAHGHVGFAFAPNWQAATNIAAYGWAAVAFAAASIVVYFCALMCTHLAAFRTAANVRKQTTEHLMHLPLGFFDTHATGELRRIIDGCAAQTETLLAHMLPDCAGSVVMVAGMLVMLFAFDWRLGLACLVAVVISICCLMSMMSGEGMKFMKQYMGALTKMNKTGTEYVRGIPVVKVFQQTVSWRPCAACCWSRTAGSASGS